MLFSKIGRPHATLICPYLVYIKYCDCDKFDTGGNVILGKVSNDLNFLSTTISGEWLNRQVSQSEKDS